jgi:DNA-binding MarR family transcriptional regulator
MSAAKNDTTKKQDVKIPRPTQIIKDLFDYYKYREYRLVQLAYKKGAKNTEIAEALEIDPTLVSRQYPKTKKESR